MTVIGLCGKSGAGKSTVSEMMERLGAAVIDTDKIYRELCVPGSDCLSEITARFGDVLCSDGTLDRKKLSAIVFSDESALCDLDKITHKYIRAETEARLKKYERLGYRAAVVDAPLLFESGFDALCDYKISVIASDKYYVPRIMSRDGIDEAAARERLMSQTDEDRLREMSDYVIENDGGTDELYSHVKAIYEKITA
ncbi:MAG: dephospho-CoA kinase [Firmicutes bacterium]|nr:dephospho-CoA kinase [Bacillota bacterium]MCD7783500.1 dephospho-CoA kinase [Bacillota bacterium]MCD7787753.1 dephospho-CoA kinase [Bacillota bacterium]MCD7831579.1 dephospho-CoA kinase [Bacillota bacterium]MCD8315132.1 dephospho-CoA kinase [Bacillota bacterium]